MKYYYALDRYLRKQFRERTIVLFYVGFFLITLAILGTAFIYLNILQPQLGVNVVLPIYLTTYLTLLVQRRIAYTYVPGVVDATVLRRQFRTDATLLGLMAVLGIPLHLYIVQGYALYGTDVPSHILAIEVVSYQFLLAVSAGQIVSVLRSNKWPRSDVELMTISESP